MQRADPLDSDEDDRQVLGLKANRRDEDDEEEDYEEGDDDDFDEFKADQRRSDEREAKKIESIGKVFGDRSPPFPLSPQQACTHAQTQIKSLIETPFSLSTQAWGKRKQSYYNADTHEFELMDESETLHEEEEEEALRMQREQRDDADEDDYDLGEVLGKGKQEKKDKKDKNKNKKGWSKDKKRKAKGGTVEEEEGEEGEYEEEEDEEGQGRALQPLSQVGAGRVKQKGKGKDKGLPSDAELLQGVSDGMEVEVERVERAPRDASKLSKQQRLEMVAADSPEVLSLLEELEDKVRQVREGVRPLLEQMREHELPTDQGVSFLEAKQHLLLSYCANVAFFLLLKAEGRAVKDHPVVQQLVHLRVMMDKMKPIDKKLKYQIDKLVKTAAIGGAAASAPASAPDADALSLRANPRALVSKEAPEAGEEALDDGLYRAPRVSATEMHLDDKASARRRQQAEKLRGKLANSAILQQMRAEARGDLPEEVRTTGGGASERRADPEADEMQAFEEENFMRLPETKEMKKKKRARDSLRINAFEDLGDFGELEALGRQLGGGGDELLDLGAELGRKKARGGAALFAAEFLPKGKRGGPVDVDEEIDDDLEGGLEDYEAAAQASKGKKADKAAKYPRVESLLQEEDPDTAEGKRKIGRNIEKNEGIKRWVEC